MSRHQVALAFEDGVTRFISCAEDQTVADASYRSRINIPLDCRDGACGTCKALCESGEFDGGDYLEDALATDEAERGFVLPCSMKPRSDLVLQIASTSAVAKTQAATYQGRLADLTRLSPTTMALSLEIDDRDQLAFLPGQYVNIAVPGTDESRSYSFSSEPDEHRLTFLMKLTPGGVMSTYLTERAAVGDEISFTGPNGSFFLRETRRPVLLLAGGTGLAPILSILRKLRTECVADPIHLIYGASTDDDLVELDTLERLGTEIDNLTWDYCVSDPASSAPHKGFVTSLIGAEHLHDGDVAVYLCGPPPMVEAVRGHFADEGVEPTGFYYEKFALSAAPAEATRADEPVVEQPPAEPIPAPRAESVPERPVDDGKGDFVEAVDNPDGRTVAGQNVLPCKEIAPLGASGAVSPPSEEAAVARAVAGQRILPAAGAEPVTPLQTDDEILVAADARNVAAQQIYPDRELEPLVQPAAPAQPGGYVIGEEHPSVHRSDSIFEARQALELGALDLTIGRLSSRQLAGYRLLAESTVPYVDGDRFVDAAAYTETNAAFHDYLFTLTGNEHLLQAYQNLGVKGRMHEVLRNATWCDPRCAQDHLDIVSAFEDGDRDAARTLVADHAERSKQTMRRAMSDSQHRVLPARYSVGRFDGMSVVVTGAAQGIGQTVARRIVAEGGSVALVDRSELVREEAGLLTAAGGTAHAINADLETWDGARAAMASAHERLGRIDVVINNVGGSIWFKPFEEYPPDEIEAEVRRSLFPTLWGCRAALPYLIEAGAGTIVNVSSNATRGINRVPYAAAKGGVNAITTALAMEAAPHGIRVVATAPGGTNAPERRVPRGPQRDEAREHEWYQQIVDQVTDSSLLKRYGTLDEQAAAITFLASDEASYITGTVLPVAGGDLG
jgi:benzoate/toluate 1,2-dioxygenase reductase subunit